MTEQELAEIRLRLQAATPGPWFVSWPCERRDSLRDEVCRCGQEWVVTDIGVRQTSIYADAEFIAHAPEDITALLAEVARLRAALGVQL